MNITERGAYLTKANFTFCRSTTSPSSFFFSRFLFFFSSPAMPRDVRLFFSSSCSEISDIYFGKNISMESGRLEPSTKSQVVTRRRRDMYTGSIGSIHQTSNAIIFILIFLIANPIKPRPVVTTGSAVSNGTDYGRRSAWPARWRSW